MRSAGIAIGLVLGTATGVAFAQWTPVSTGLTGSVPRVTVLVVDHSTGSTLYAVTSANSVFNVFKSVDGGANWGVLTTVASVNVLVLDPASGSTIYAGTAQGLLKSTDGGATWNSIAFSDTSVSNLAVDPTTPSTLYAGTNGHLYKSTDAGGSWTDLKLTATGGTDGLWIAGLVVDPSTPSTLYVALGEGAGGNIIKSVDAGASWKVIFANAGPFYETSSNLVIDPSNPSTLYRINPLEKSTDGGASWTPITYTFPPANGGYSAYALAVDPRNSNTLYLSTFGIIEHAIFQSPDGGQSWNEVNTIIPGAVSLAFGPDSRTIYAATGSGVFKSTDAGTNWNATNAGLLVFDMRVLVGDPIRPATVYAGGNDGLFKSVDGGAKWSPLATFAVYSLLIDFTNSSVLYADTGPRGFLEKTTDGGSTWSNLEFGGYGGAIVMDPDDPNTLYDVNGDDYDGFTISKSVDGGANWQDLYASALAQASWVNALLIDRDTPTTLYAATDLGLLRSTDGGKSFLPTGLANTPVAALAIDPVHPNVFYAATSNNPYPNDSAPPGLVGLYKSTDGGANWSPINQGLDEILAAHATVNALVVDPERANILYLATSGYGVFRSTDGGATWTAFNDGLTLLDVRSLALVRPARRGGQPRVPGSTTLYAGTPGGIFRFGK